MTQSKNRRTIISLSLPIGPIPEEKISNKLFLDSYLEYSCWMRMFNAKQSLNELKKEKIGELEQISALAAFYQNAGLTVEDSLTMLIAWAIWSRDKTQLLADILKRISLILSNPVELVPSDYSEEIIRKLMTTNKRVNVYPREFLTQTLSATDNDLPKMFGIPWKPQPSVKLVPKEYQEHWANLGSHIRQSIQILLNPKGAHLAACYNKIKHGPQILISDLATASKARGLDPEINEQIDKKSMSKLTVRLLLDGARTQESVDEEEKSIRIAPFLWMDYTNTKNWFFQNIVHSASTLFIIGTWLYNSTYKEKKRSLKPKQTEIQAIIREQGRHGGFE